MHRWCDLVAVPRVAWHSLRVHRAVLIAGWVALALALPFVGSAFGGGGIALGVALVIAIWAWQWLWLPRSAHAAFARGRHARALRRYRWLALLTVSPARRRAIALSRIGCFAAEGNHAAATAAIEELPQEQLDASERAALLNNRACLALAQAPPDPYAALELADQATALRPDVPGLQHTRGMALLAVGRVDDAIAVLDKIRAAGELPERLEAERCRDLARAWTLKGEAAYANDYRMRADALGR